jgi:hypothetical protein
MTNGCWENVMWKIILAGTTALVIAGSTVVLAQQGDRDARQRWQPSVEDMRAFGEGRLAALKAGLMLTADQEKNWPTFEQAAREFTKLRIERIVARREARRADQPPTDDPIARMRRRGTAMTETGAVVTRLADATEPLYTSLDEAQKRRFALLARPFVAAPRGFQRGRWQRGEGRERMRRWHRSSDETQPFGNGAPAAQPGGERL